MISRFDDIRYNAGEDFLNLTLITISFQRLRLTIAKSGQSVLTAKGLKLSEIPQTITNGVIVQ